MALAQQCSLQSNKKTIFIFHSPGVNPSWETKTSSMIHFKHLWARATLLYIRLCFKLVSNQVSWQKGNDSQPQRFIQRERRSWEQFASLHCSLLTPNTLPAVLQPTNAFLQRAPLWKYRLRHFYTRRKYIAFPARSPRCTCKKPSHDCPFMGSVLLLRACGHSFPGQGVMEQSQCERSRLPRDSRIDYAINNPCTELLEQLNFNWVTQEIILIFLRKLLKGHAS